jgi:hypothetical protein
MDNADLLQLSKKIKGFSMMSDCVQPSIMAPIFSEMIEGFEKVANKTANPRLAEIVTILKEHHVNIANPRLKVSVWDNIFEDIGSISDEIKSICEEN